MRSDPVPAIEAEGRTFVFYIDCGPMSSFLSPFQVYVDTGMECSSFFPPRFDLFF